ncbi:MAG: YlmC/YmxH family sporulation protein [Lachnospiraceae bacterium]|nr:YlmC/YmxH family sporulation protein [Lachnospiraceae bacterium]
MLYSDFKNKEVVNIRDCRRLGKIGDFEFDECTGHIQKLIIPAPWCFNTLLGNIKEYKVYYKDIKQIGPDIILVDVPY